MIAIGLYCQVILYLTETGLIDKYHILRRSGYPTSLFDMPLLYLYVLALTVPGFRWSRKYWPHALPFVFGLMWYLVFVTLPPDSPFWRDTEVYQIERYARVVVGV